MIAGWRAQCRGCSARLRHPTHPAHPLRPHPLPCQNFRGTYLVGEDVVGALRRELAAAGVDAEVPAIMNDTVATLVGAACCACCVGGGKM